MEVRRQLQAMATLPPGKATMASTKQEADWAP